MSHINSFLTTCAIFGLLAVLFCGTTETYTTYPQGYSYGEFYNNYNNLYTDYVHVPYTNYVYTPSSYYYNNYLRNYYHTYNNYYNSYYNSYYNNYYNPYRNYINSYSWSLPTTDYYTTTTRTVEYEY
jgi:hypothetical protein